MGLETILYSVEIEFGCRPSVLMHRWRQISAAKSLRNFIILHDVLYQRKGILGRLWLVYNVCKPCRDKSTYQVLNGVHRSFAIPRIGTLHCPALFLRVIVQEYVVAADVPSTQVISSYECE